MPIKHGRTDAQRTNVVRMQNEFAARQVVGHDGRHLEAVETAPLYGRTPHIDADISPGNQRPETRYVAACEARPDHPEARVLDQVVARVAVDAGGYNGFFTVLGDMNAGDVPDLDILVANLGLIRFYAVGAEKIDVDARSLGQFLLNHHERSGHDDHRRQDPYER